MRSGRCHKKLTPEELNTVDLSKAIECRLIITRRRADPKDAQGVDQSELTQGEWKARLVVKDLKAKRKVALEATYAEVPTLYAFRLMMAGLGIRKDILSIDDYKCAYTQSGDYPL